jgi:hypothetical protein
VNSAVRCNVSSPLSPDVNCTERGPNVLYMNIVYAISVYCDNPNTVVICTSSEDCIEVGQRPNSQNEPFSM